MKHRTHFRVDSLSPVEEAGERALRVRKLGKRDAAARARAATDFEAARASLGERFDAYAKCVEHLARKHLRARLARTLSVRAAPTVASVFGQRQAAPTVASVFKDETPA